MDTEKLLIAHELANTYAKTKGIVRVETIHYFDKEKKPKFKLRAWPEIYQSHSLTIDELIERLTSYIDKTKKENAVEV